MLDNPTVLSELVKSTGLAGIIALMAWWAMVQVFKRIDRAQDQTDAAQKQVKELIEHVKDGFALVRDNSSEQSGTIQALMKTHYTDLANKIDRLGGG